MPSPYTLKRTVAFSETDSAGIVHFSNFFRYMEDAEHAYLRSLGLSVHRELGDGVAGFPRVNAQCDYRRPLRFEDEFTITVNVVARTDKSVTYGFSFEKTGEPSPIASGTLKAVYAVKPAGTQKYSAAALPPEIDRLLSVSAEEPAG
ncbi:MAG: thioesterase family protein [Planctomycetota bacterium]